MTDGHLQGRQKLQAARRAGAAAPGPSGPGPTLPARGGRQRQRAAAGTRPARGRGGLRGPRPNAQPGAARGTPSLGGPERRQLKPARPTAGRPPSEAECPAPGVARPPHAACPGPPRGRSSVPGGVPSSRAGPRVGPPAAEARALGSHSHPAGAAVRARG
ncbi:basic proline-rich protein-like [Artibeus jamaicensis]|uniref:basic proline-rich protein-like n=1 Tax=Artibeus jamaicensis TaxID=9417 RepID=UPI00235AA775|nr:basic proline-rich protein-like [Artibeus jamaicensis]